MRGRREAVRIRPRCECIYQNFASTGTIVIVWLLPNVGISYIGMFDKAEFAHLVKQESKCLLYERNFLTFHHKRYSQIRKEIQTAENRQGRDENWFLIKILIYDLGKWLILSFHTNIMDRERERIETWLGVIRTLSCKIVKTNVQMHWLYC